MQKPNGYDSVQTGSEYTPIILGGHAAVIKKVLETTSAKGKPMLKVAIDFDANDKQPEYFMNAFKADDRPDKRWPYQGTQYIVAEDKDGNCSKALKSFIEAVEQSNNSKVVWGSGFADWFTNRRVGVVYGVVEEAYNGEVKRRHRLRWFCQYEGAVDRPAPAPRLMDPSEALAHEGFVPVPADSPFDSPF